MLCYIVSKSIFLFIRVCVLYFDTFEHQLYYLKLHFPETTAAVYILRKGRSFKEHVEDVKRSGLQVPLRTKSSVRNTPLLLAGVSVLWNYSREGWWKFTFADQFNIDSVFAAFFILER